MLYGKTSRNCGKKRTGNSPKQKAANDYAARIKKQKDDEIAKKNDPKEVGNQICELMDSIRSAMSQMDQEKEVTKVSGIVNKETMHNLGMIIVTSREQLGKDFKHYSKVTGGKNFNISKCQKRPQEDEE